MRTGVSGVADETLNLLRQVMIDHALEMGDREAFRNLTGPNWKAFVVNTENETPTESDPLAFLSEDPRFWDLRLYEQTLVRPYLNYRFRDTIDGILYVAEIRIPIGWPGKVEAKFRPRPSSGPSVRTPDWFVSLLAAVTNILQLELTD